jgi:hypothetical protein
MEVMKSLQFGISSPMSSPDDKAELAFIGQIINTNFEEEGRYLFRIYVNDILIDEIPLEVKKH